MKGSRKAAQDAQNEAAENATKDNFIDELNNTPEEAAQTSHDEAEAERLLQEKREQDDHEREEAAEKALNEAKKKATNDDEEFEFERPAQIGVRFCKLENEGEFFEGRFIRTMHSPSPKNADWPKGDDEFSGVLFEERGTGEQVILPTRWELFEYFYNKGIPEAAAVRWNENPIFRITVKEKVLLKNGNTVVKHAIQVGYPKKK